MSRMSRLTFSVLCVLVLCLLSRPLAAQLPANPIGINPPGLKWRQIRTDKVQVVFPEGLDSAGQRVANLVHYLWDRNASIGDKTIPVSIFLQNQPVISNGFVTPGPFRSEFYTTSPQNNQATDWLDVLAIHEYRHVQQFANTDRGITGVVKSVLGSWPWGGMFGLAMPRWFYEGDATGIETALTATGRGRLPAFDMEYRTLVLDGIQYDYEKAGAGSLRDFVPNWYRLGYYLTTYARTHHGAGIWAGVVEDAVRYRGLFFPFSRSLKRRTGLSTSELYRAAYRELDSLWRPALTEKAARAVEGRVVPIAPKPTVIHYNNAHYLPDGRVVAEKRGFDRIPAYVAVDAGGAEQKLTAPGVLFGPDETTLSVQGSLLCWAELGFDPRWRNRTFSIIKTYDLANGEKRKLTSATRLFAPALSPDSRRIVALEAGEDLRYALVVLDAATGAVERRLPNPGGFFFAYPRWVDGNTLVAVASRDEQTTLQLIDATTGKAGLLTPPTPHQLTHPFPRGEYVFFAAAYTGTNNIFAVRLRDGEVFQLTDVLTGAFQPSVSAAGDRLLYSAFTVNGYEVHELDLQTTEWRPVQPGTLPFAIRYFEPLVAQEGGGSIVGRAPRETFSVSKYNKWSGIINPHSILPYLEHPTYGLQVLSDNKFSTLSASANAYYNVNEGELTYGADLRYAELFPVISGRFQRANRSAVIYNFAPVTDSTVQRTVFVERWAENDASAGLSLPINLSAGNAVTQLNLRADYHFLTIDPENRFDRPGNFRDTVRVGSTRRFSEFIRPLPSGRSLQALDLGLTFVSFRRQAIQHLNPRLGLVLGLRYRQALHAGPLRADNLLARADLYLPGLRRDHSLYFNTMFQRQDLLDNYRFADVFAYPRGYPSQLADEFARVGVNYSLPLAYPDWALGPVAFIKRIKTNFFFDLGTFTLNEPFNRSRNLWSGGAELRLDFRALRLLEIDAGLRYSYLSDPAFGPNGSRHQFDFLLISISE